MDKRISGIKKNIIIIVSLTALIFLAAGAVLGLWSAREMKRVVGNSLRSSKKFITVNCTAIPEQVIERLGILVAKYIS